jgi:hypothetical protein
MVPSNLGDLWISKLQITFEKVTWHAIIDLGSSVSAIFKELYDQLEIGAMEKCDIDLLLVDISIIHVLGRVNNVMVELHMTLCASGFYSNGHGRNPSSLILLSRFLF